MGTAVFHIFQENVHQYLERLFQSKKITDSFIKEVEGFFLIKLKMKARGAARNEERDIFVSNVINAFFGKLQPAKKQC